MLKRAGGHGPGPTGKTKPDQGLWEVRGRPGTSPPQGAVLGAERDRGRERLLSCARTRRTAARWAAGAAMKMHATSAPSAPTNRGGFLPGITRTPAAGRVPAADNRCLGFLTPEEPRGCNGDRGLAIAGRDDRGRARSCVNASRETADGSGGEEKARHHLLFLAGLRGG